MFVGLTDLTTQQHLQRSARLIPTMPSLRPRRARLKRTALMKRKTLRTMLQKMRKTSKSKKTTNLQSKQRVFRNRRARQRQSMQRPRSSTPKNSCFCHGRLVLGFILENSSLQIEKTYTGRLRSLPPTSPSNYL